MNCRNFKEARFRFGIRPLICYYISGIHVLTQAVQYPLNITNENLTIKPLPPTCKQHLAEILSFKSIGMQTNQIITAKRDFICINSNDPNELIYLHRQFPKKTSAEIKDAMKKFGPLRENIVAQLEEIKPST